MALLPITLDFMSGDLVVHQHLVEAAYAYQ
jgi:hypothetical protein